MHEHPSFNERSHFKNVFSLLFALEQSWSPSKVWRRNSNTDFWKKVLKFQSVEACANWPEICEELFPEIEKRRLSELKTRTQRHFEYCEKSGMRVITPADKEHQGFNGLQEEGPFCFSIYGPTLNTNSTKIGIIGTRKPSIKGIKVAFHLGKELTLRGAEVFSGGAYGCDIAALWGALDTKLVPNKLSIVFPSGLKELRPKGLMRSFEHLRAAGGRWISPFFFDHEPRKYDYLYRNQFLARLIHTLYVVEAPEKSGSMSTATACALRDIPIKVWSPPGVIPSGNAALLQDFGAEGFRVSLSD